MMKYSAATQVEIAALEEKMSITTCSVVKKQHIDFVENIDWLHRDHEQRWEVEKK